MKSKKLLLLIGSICLMLVVAMLPAMSACAPAAPKVEPVKIGALLDFTGPIASFGPRFIRGIEMALEEANYEAGGRSIELIVEDTASDATIALEKQKKLVETDGCYLAIGPLMGDQQMAIAPYAAENKVLRTSLINGLAEDVNYGTVLMYPTTCIGQQRASGWYMYDELGARTMVTVGADYAGGHAYIAGVVYGFEERGGEVVQQIWAPPGTRDYAPYVSSIEKADALAFFIVDGVEIVDFMRAYEVGGPSPLPVLFQLIHECFTQEQLAAAGDIVVGLKAQSTYPWNRDDPLNNAFVAAFKAKYGELPTNEQNSYTMTKMLLAGLEATGGDDSYEAMRSAILGMEIDTPQGPLSWTPEGVAITDIYIVEIQKVGGENVPVIIKTYRDATDDPFVKKIGQ